MSLSLMKFNNGVLKIKVMEGELGIGQGCQDMNFAHLGFLMGAAPAVPLRSVQLQIH
eukprot:m.77316 g.77316  ORF g.77316 m.77316 type:complete len:57 (-) comp20670_c0_seq3:705-875(-)